MKTISVQNNVAVLRFDRGEEVVSGLAEYCRVENIRAGSFGAIGAAEKVVLSFYDPEMKKYDEKEFNEVEITGLSGNISCLEKNDAVVVHAHGNFAGRDFVSVGGHIKSCVVSLTCELVLHVLPVVLNRQLDSETGLNLLV